MFTNFFVCRAVLFCLERRPLRRRRSLGDLIKSCFALFEATDKLQGPVARSMVSVNNILVLILLNQWLKLTMLWATQPCPVLLIYFTSVLLIKRSLYGASLGKQMSGIKKFLFSLATLAWISDTPSSRILPQCHLIRQAVNAVQWSHWRSMRLDMARGYVGNSGYYHSLIVLDCTSLFNWRNKPCWAGSKLKQFSWFNYSTTIYHVIQYHVNVSF